MILGVEPGFMWMRQKNLGVRGTRCIAISRRSCPKLFSTILKRWMARESVFLVTVWVAMVP